MKTDREVMQMALDALEIDLRIADNPGEILGAAITALREALARPEQERAIGSELDTNELASKLTTAAVIIGNLPELPGYNGSILTIDDTEAERIAADLVLVRDRLREAPPKSCTTTQPAEREPEHGGAVSFTRSEFRNGWTTFNIRSEDADEAERRLSAGQEPVEVWNGNRKVTVYEDMVLQSWGPNIESQEEFKRTAQQVQDSFSWLFSASQPAARTSQAKQGGKA